jgi:SUKH superfamily protein
VDRPTPRYQRIADLFRAQTRSDGADLVARPATPDELAAAEQALGTQLPDSYRWFQLEFGNVAHGPVDIYSVRTPESSELDIVGINLDERHNAYPRLPAHLIAFSDNGGGDLLCFDSTARHDGECVVVWWDHEGEEGQRPEPAASSFLDWLERELRESAAEPRGLHLGYLPRLYLGWIRDWLKNRPR